MRKLKLLELKRKNPQQYKAANKLPVKIVLDNVRSLSNVGAAFRTADAFLVEEIILGGITAQPPHREITKTALGATESVPWAHEKNVVEAFTKLKEQGYKCLAVEQTDDSVLLQNFQVDNEKLALFFGHEVNGVSDDLMPLLDGSIEIPQHGTKHSFNVSVSIGIVLWSIYEKFLENGLQLE